MIRKTNKWVAVMTAGALILTSINMPFNKSQGNAATTYGIDNPRIEKDVVVSGEDVAKVIMAQLSRQKFDVFIMN